MADAGIGFRTRSLMRRNPPAAPVAHHTRLTSIEPVAVGTYVETRLHVRVRTDSLDFLQNELVARPNPLPRTRGLHSERSNPLDGKSCRRGAGQAVAGIGRTPAVAGSAAAAAAAGHRIATRTLHHEHFREAAGTCRMAVARHC